jgi:hypothetical protein
MVSNNSDLGHLDRCQICGTKSLEEVLDLGFQPLCDSLLTASQLHQPEVTYPLRLMRCPKCTLTQLDYAVAGNIVYHPDYPYKSGISEPLVEYLDTFSEELMESGTVRGTALVVDVGSNDGTLLAAFRKRGLRVIGVEPTNIAELARKQNIPTIQAFFTERVARDIVSRYGQPSLVTATNAFAHMADLDEVVRGMKTLIGSNGTIVIENHYLIDVLQRMQFDTIYHEHIRTYSLRSLVTLFGNYDLEVVDAIRVPRYGGSIRVQVAPKGLRCVNSSVSELLHDENVFGLAHSEPYEHFRRGVEQLKVKTMHYLYDLLGTGCRIVGNSCPGRCVTLVNYFGIDRAMIPYIAELPNSLKLGYFLPGKQIPIVDNSILVKEQPDYVILFAWHYADAMIKNLRNIGVKSRLIQLLPKLRVHSL